MTRDEIEAALMGLAPKLDQLRALSALDAFSAEVDKLNASIDIIRDGKFLEAFRGQFGRGHPPRRGQEQPALGHKSAHRFARGRHRHAIVAPDAAQGQGLARRQIAMHDRASDAAIDALMGGPGGGGIGGARDLHDHL